MNSIRPSRHGRIGAADGSHAGHSPAVHELSRINAAGLIAG